MAEAPDLRPSADGDGDAGKAPSLAVGAQGDTVAVMTPATGSVADGLPANRSAGSTKPRSILRSAGAQSSAGSRRTRFSSGPDEAASR